MDDSGNRGNKPYWSSSFWIQRLGGDPDQRESAKQKVRRLAVVHSEITLLLMVLIIVAWAWAGLSIVGWFDGWLT